ncbi:protein of unknown function [Denitratisoma oestradiolicum]|uniref:Phage tail protein n=1 Tax=Denitratisoma oestradiolicum TaxID=311182 RepID=A0A6S6YHP9_9PROT|nr:phage tail protein [Denitratisoma oestradiolicum]CAB1367244.1 protein of unknown function [Denitratisoma oestradiolicum]
MTADHLLPANATPLERALSLATNSLSRLTLPADAIRQFKTDPSDPLLPWLIWEYGLGELLPYLPEPRRAIAEGILWQRLRGTPAALATALSWIGMRATVEQEPPGVRFAEFQLDPGEVLDNDTAIANLIAIARLSAPARSRLSRIYHGHDLRRVLLDESRLGEALLSDHSGVFWRDGQTKLSFGRGHQWVNPPPDIVLAPAREAVRFVVARLIDRTLLDFSSLVNQATRSTRRSCTRTCSRSLMRWACLIHWGCAPSGGFAGRWWCSRTARPWATSTPTCRALSGGRRARR